MPKKLKYHLVNKKEGKLYCNFSIESANGRVLNFDDDYEVEDVCRHCLNNLQKELNLKVKTLVHEIGIEEFGRRLGIAMK